MAARPGDELEAAGHGHLRASHADREQVIGILKAAFAHGRLTKDELDTRAGQAFTARTYAELAALRADGPTPYRLGVLPGAVPAADEQCSQGGHMSGHCGSRAGGPVVHRWCRALPPVHRHPLCHRAV